MDDTNGKIDLQVSHPRSSDSTASRRVNVRVVDRASRLMIVEFDLTAAQFVDAISSTYVSEVDAWIAPTSQRWKLGHETEHEKINVPSEIGRRIPHGKTSLNVRSDAESLPATVRDWAADNAVDWHEWSLYKHNYGWALHLVRYV